MAGIDSPLFGIQSRQPPSNLAAEQALLGAILIKNSAMDTVTGLKPEHFADPVNGFIFRECCRLIEAGRTADAVTLKSVLEHTGALDEVGGAGYLTKLMSAMVSVSMAGDYARVVRDAWTRRQVIEIGAEAVDLAFGARTDIDGEGVIASAVDRLMSLSDYSASATVDIADGIDDAIAAAEEAHRGGRPIGLPLGLRALTDLWGGLFPGNLDILGARSEHGKTALASQIMTALAFDFADAAKAENRKPDSIAFFSLEMSKTDIATRMLATATGIPSDDIKNGRLSEARGVALVTARKRLRGLPILVYDRPGQTISDIQVAARMAVKRKRARLVVIDHLHRIKPSGPVARSPKLDQIAYITEALKDLARSLQVPILLLAQLSRDIERREDQRPTVADIKYAGEADADNIMLLWRPELHMGANPPDLPAKLANDEAKVAEFNDRWWKRRDSVRGKAEVIAAKRRFGPVGQVWLTFHGPTTTFSDPNDAEEAQGGMF